MEFIYGIIEKNNKYIEDVPIPLLNYLINNDIIFSEKFTNYIFNSFSPNISIILCLKNNNKDLYDNFMSQLSIKNIAYHNRITKFLDYNKAEENVYNTDDNLAVKISKGELDCIFKSNLDFEDVEKLFESVNIEIPEFIREIYKIFTILENNRIAKFIYDGDYYEFDTNSFCYNYLRINKYNFYNNIKSIYKNYLILYELLCNEFGTINIGFLSKDYFNKNYNIICYDYVNSKFFYNGNYSSFLKSFKLLNESLLYLCKPVINIDDIYVADIEYPELKNQLAAILDYSIINMDNLDTNNFYLIEKYYLFNDLCSYLVDKFNLQ